MSQPGIDRIKFTPAARPVDTVGVDTSFQRMAAPMQKATESLQPVMDRMPAPPVQSNRAAQLVEALSTFTKTITEVGNIYDKQKQDEERLQAEYDAQASSAKTWEEAVQNKPELAMKSPFYRNTFLARTATNAMMAKFGQLQAEYYQSPLVNSTDPTEVNKWLQERLQPDLDKITDPAGREAALKFIRERSATFMNAHQTNATQNLIKKRQESFGAGYTATLDESGALPAAKSYDVGMIFAKDLPVEAQGFLAGLGAAEASGKYNVRYGGAQGPQPIDTTQPHQNVGSVITSGPNAGKTSSAAGKYQFIYGTWVKANGGENKPMTEENQDRAAWSHAVATYKEKTGRDLQADLKEQGLTQGIMRSLGGQWEAWAKGGRDDLARYAATYNESLRRNGSAPPENAAGKDPNFNALTAKLWDNHEAQVKGGEKPEQADKDLVQSVVNKVMETQDTSYLKILDTSRGGRPALSKDPEVSKTIFNTIRQAEALKVDRQNAAHRLQEKQQKLRVEKLTADYFGQSVEKIRNGQDPSYSWDTIAAAYKVDSDLGEKLVRLNKTFEEGQTREDHRDLNDLWGGIYMGRVSMQDLVNARLDGRVNNPQTLKSMADEIQSQRDKTWLSGPVWRSGMASLDRFFGDPDSDKPELAQQHFLAQSQVSKAFSEWMKADPSRAHDFDAQKVFLDKQIAAVVSAIRPDTLSGTTTAYGGQNTTTPGSKPAPAQKPAQGQQAAPAPAAPTTDWRSQKLFNDYGDLQEAIKEYRSNPKTSRIAQTAERLGLKSPTEIVRMVEAQGRLMIADPTKK